MNSQALADEPLQPTAETTRIETLDVLRGFALLGILLLNIIGFGLVSTAYSNPQEGFFGPLDMPVWAGVEIFAEGAMRGLFSLLFGAGVVLFTSADRGPGIFFKRHGWLLAFGLFDGFVLLWNGDILTTYAVAGAILYTARNSSPRRLLIAAGALIVLMSAFYGATGFGMEQARQAAEQVAQATQPDALPAQVHEGAQMWEDFAADFELSDQDRADELAARRDSYWSAFQWNSVVMQEMLFFVLPLILLWDALAFMLIGMALYKLGVLQGERSDAFYVRMAVAGFAIGLCVNSWEVFRAASADFALLATFAQAQATYHIGRLGMGLGYLSVLVLLCKHGVMGALRQRLACVGRIALTNYLMHSLICLFVFTGAGLGMVGQLERFQLYLLVVAIWVFQLWFSPWWLARYRFGPLEWLWRGLTYGRWPDNQRRDSA